jgi:hypothetical protein
MTHAVESPLQHGSLALIVFLLLSACVDSSPSLGVAYTIPCSPNGAVSVVSPGSESASFTTFEVGPMYFFVEIDPLSHPVPELWARQKVLDNWLRREGCEDAVLESKQKPRSQFNVSYRPVTEGAMIGMDILFQSGWTPGDSSSSVLRVLVGSQHLVVISLNPRRGSPSVDEQIAFLDSLGVHES